VSEFSGSGPVVAIVGAGPAGLRAAETLALAGLRPVLFDEAPRPGGQIYRQPPAGAERPGADLYGFEAGKAAAVHAILPGLGDRIDHRPSTLVWNVHEGRLDSLCEGAFGELAFDRLILATGAMDRIIPFPGWTLPGVFSLGAAQIALKAQGVAIGRRVALVGAGPLLPLVAHQYASAGADIAAVLDVTPFSAKLRNAARLASEPLTLAKGLFYTARTALRGARRASGVRAIRVEGAGRVEALAWTGADGREQRVACDAVGASFGLRSEAQLADLAGCRFAFDDMTRQWAPQRKPEGRSSQPEIYLAGDGSGVGGVDVAELQGRRTALAVLEDLGQAINPAEVARLDAALARQARFRTALEAAYPYPEHLVAAIPDEEILCRCEGVTAGALRDAVRRQGATEVNRVKAFTRIGMGRCQGRVCGHASAELVARELGAPVEAAGRLRGQPPVKPIPILGAPR
jgi:NADPH-dependent 2,4-dienoyl-CoA reductase/sulfur reductase-like enzyme